VKRKTGLTNLVKSHSLALAILQKSIAHIFMGNAVPKKDAEDRRNANIVPLGLLVIVNLHIF
jgi:hypothetical protein